MSASNFSGEMPATKGGQYGDSLTRKGTNASRGILNTHHNHNRPGVKLSPRRGENHKVRPGYAELYRIGVAVNNQLPKEAWRMSFVEIGLALGMSRQAAMAECLLALGKLAYAARKSVKSEL